LSQYFIAQQKNESVCEISEHKTWTAFEMSALLGNSFSSFLAKKNHIPRVFDQNFIFKTQHVSFELKETFMTFDAT